MLHEPETGDSLMAFADNIALLRDPGDNAIAPSIYDDLLSDYDSQVSLAEGAGAKVAEYEAMVAELTALEPKAGEEARLKTLNPGDPVAVEAGLTAWTAANPTPQATLADVVAQAASADVETNSAAVAARRMGMPVIATAPSTS